jgi:pyruvate/2-oxoglutarate dehydrogenase complex dihydrolipoamide acyltransferase (E2) component
VGSFLAKGKGNILNNKEVFRKEKLSFARKAVIAFASVTKEKNTIHSFTEVDISIPRKLLHDYAERNGERISFTGYITKCLANTITKYPRLNSFIRGNSIVYLNDITISILIERELDGDAVPEPLGIKNCGNKSLYSIHKEIRNAQKNQDNRLGGLSGNSWFQYIPAFLLKSFIRIADKNISMGVEYGKIAITAVGMFSHNPIWFIPHGSATVLLTIGSINNKVVSIDGVFEAREHLCLTVSFNHDIVDGAPAARFMNDLVEEIKQGKEIINLLNIKE